MFGWEYPPLHLGGLGVACQGIVRGLKHHGVKVTLVLPHPNASEPGVDVISPTKDWSETIHVQSMLSPYESTELYAKRISSIPKELQHIYGADLPQAVAHFTEMSVEMTKDVPTDIVHCHDWMTYGAGTCAAHYHDKPLITHIHATELDRTNFNPNEWIYKLERKGFNKADKIIAVSNYTKNILTEHYGISPDKIHVVHNGSSEQIQMKECIHTNYRETKNPMVLFLGRMTIQKGPVQFLKMAENIHRIRPEVQFVMAGEGNMMSEIIDRACEMNLHDCIVFTGKVSDDEAKSLYRQADCFVMPSLSEPFGLVALEAISHGTPVVLSKQSGASEVVAHGFKVDFWDTDKMSDCVLTILREDSLANQLKSEAPHILKQLTWINQGQQVHSIYKDLISS